MAGYPFTPQQEAWLRDLETTEEPQTRGALHRLTSEEDPVGYCCLGRACVVLGIKEGEGEDCDGGSLGLFLGHDTTLPKEIWQLLHLRDAAGILFTSTKDGHTSLVELNDARWTFKEIAAYVRLHPRNVLTNQEIGNG